MKIRTRLTLLMFFIASFAVCLFAGCKIGEMTADEFLKKNDAENQCVTYFANGGSFNGTAARTKMDIYYQVNSYIMCSETNNFKISRTDYTFDAWYYISVDGEGNPVCDSNGEIILGEKVKPTDRIPENKHLYVAAGWSANVAIRVHLVTEDGFEVEDGDGNKYKTGDVVNTINFGVFSSYELYGAEDAIDAVNATYLYYFEDADCTKPILNVKKPVGTDTEFIDVYVRYLKGEWNVVSKPADVRNMFIYSSDTRRCPNYYLFTEDNSGVIDCASANTVTLSNATFLINIEGNGVIIDNLGFESSGSSALTGGNNSILGKLGASSSIKNLTLRNVTVTATARSGNPEICLVSNGYEDGISGENFTGFRIETATLNLSTAAGASIYNIQNNNTDCWLFGVYEEITDDEFTAVLNGFEVAGATLIINKTTVVENKTIIIED